MGERIEERAWTCLGCGYRVPGDLAPALGSDCPCGDNRWTYRVGERTKAENAERHNHLTRDIRPLGECPKCDEYHRRHPAENAERLEAMSASAKASDAAADLSAMLDASTLERDRLRDDVTAYREAYEIAAAECERLRVIVDLDLAEYAALIADQREPWIEAERAHRAAIRAEIERRRG